MRRRRQKNPLLLRIIAISILVHIIALPVLAHFGAFKKIQERFAGPQIVFVPPPPETHERQVQKREAKQPPRHPQQVARRAAHTQPHAARVQPKSNLNTPHVIEGAKTDTGDSGAGTVAQGTGATGVVPTEKPAPEKPVEPQKPVEAPKPVEKVAETEKPVEKTAKPVEKTVESIKPAEPVKAPAPVFASAEPLSDSQPQPVIPDDLRADALDKMCVVEFVVGPDGRPTSVQIATSTNVQELDRLALDAARRWRFRPATRNGQPVESRVRLHIEFQVS